MVVRSQRRRCGSEMSMAPTIVVRAHQSAASASGPHHERAAAACSPRLSLVSSRSRWLQGGPVVLGRIASERGAIRIGRPVLGQYDSRVI